MPTKKSSSRSHASREGKKSSSSKSAKFIPSLKQLNEASKELPDPELWPDKTYLYPVEVDGKQRMIEFTRKSVQRGQGHVARWIYEGKVLIRKRDL